MLLPWSVYFKLLPSNNGFSRLDCAQVSGGCKYNISITVYRKRNWPDFIKAKLSNCTAQQTIGHTFLKTCL